MALGKPKTPAPTMAVTLWKVEYHHLAFRSPVTGNQSSTFFTFLLCPSSAMCSYEHHHEHHHEHHGISNPSGYLVAKHGAGWKDWRGNLGERCPSRSADVVCGNVSTREEEESTCTRERRTERGVGGKLEPNL